MTWEIYYVLGLLGLALFSFIKEKISTDQTALLVFAILIAGSFIPGENKLPDISQLILVFANPAPLTIAAMFIMSAALDKTGVIDWIARSLSGLARLGYVWMLLVLVFAVALISAFINNTPVVVIFTPVVLSLARTMQVPASKMLIPLSYASIFGGVSTLVGTSTNILGSGILKANGYEPIGMFELAKIGVPMLFVSAVYLVFIGRKLLPNRETLTSILPDELRREYMTDAVIRPGSGLIGKTPSETRLLAERNVRIIDIIRNGVELHGNLNKVELKVGDRLILAARPSGIAHARSVEGLDLMEEQELGLDTIAAHEGQIVEGVVGPLSGLIGRTASDLNFRQRYQMVLLAIHRHGQNLRRDIHTTPFAFGDTLLMMGSDAARERLRSSSDILLLDQPATPPVSQRKKMPIVLAVMAGIITAVTAGWAAIEAVALIGVAVIIVTGCLKTKEAYASVDWSILILIYGMLGLGQAMEASGATELVSTGLIQLSEFGFSASMRPYILLAALYLISNVLTAALSNNAVIVIMAPIAIGLGVSLGVDPRPFVIACTIASSADFSTPIGYQTNTYVYGVGGYKFLDFIKVGTPLNLLYFVASVILIPLFWGM